MEEEAKICALCKWNRNVMTHFYCSNPIQSDENLKANTEYNDGCGLFSEKEERRNMYDFWDQDITNTK